MKILIHSLVLSLVFASSGAGAEKPNVLMIAIDDLNDWVGCLGGHPQASTPNIDRLAERGTLFTNAHCQAPICNPSRTSLMLGLRPSTTGVYVNAPKHWSVPALRGKVTLPRHFAANGYVTLTAGKIYHGSGLPDGDFDIVGPRPGQRNAKHDRRVQAELKGLWDFGPQQFKDELFGDHQTASWAIRELAVRRDRPFLMALGFYRPHVPWYAPQRWFDSIPVAGVTLPETKPGDRDDLPAAATALAANKTPPPHAWFLEGQNWKLAVQAYHASVRFTDEQLGRVLDALDASPHKDDTVIVLYSDHGFHLGEKERWAKQSLWERSTKVPLIISAPGKPAGQSCGAPAELLSIYPTLIELCGIGKRGSLEGVSLVPLLEDSSAAWLHLARTTYQRNNHAVRDARYRYIRYADGREELYDHQSDPGEWTNLAGKAELEPVKVRLAGKLPTVNAPSALGKRKRLKPQRAID